MRTLVTSVFVMGLVAGAVAVGTSNAASTLPKAPAPKSPAKKKTPPIFEPLRPLHISEDGTPLRCMHNTE